MTKAKTTLRWSVDLLYSYRISNSARLRGLVICLIWGKKTGRGDRRLMSIELYTSFEPHHWTGLRRITASILLRRPSSNFSADSSLANKATSLQANSSSLFKDLLGHIVRENAFTANRPLLLPFLLYITIYAIQSKGPLAVSTLVPFLHNFGPCQPWRLKTSGSPSVHWWLDAWFPSGTYSQCWLKT